MNSDRTQNAAGGLGGRPLLTPRDANTVRAPDVAGRAGGADWAASRWVQTMMPTPASATLMAGTPSRQVRLPDADDEGPEPRRAASRRHGAPGRGLLGGRRWSTSRPWPHHDHPTYLPQPATSSVTGYGPTKKWRSPQTFDTQQKGHFGTCTPWASPAGPATPDPTCPTGRSLAGERCAGPAPPSARCATRQEWR